MSRGTEVDAEKDFIQGAKLNTLHDRPFPGGSSFQVVYQTEDGFEVQLASRTSVKVRYLYLKEDIDGVEIIKLLRDKPAQILQLNNFDFQQLRAFLSFVATTDLDSIPQKIFAMNEDARSLEAPMDGIKKLLARGDGEEIIQALIAEGCVTSSDIVNTAYRKKQLAIFDRLMKESEYWKTYAEAESISDYSEEKVWQHFFNKNDWIFGYGLDYRFNGILQREFYASGTEADGSESVICDYLLGDTKFTTFVEIKKPSTPIFAKQKNRSSSWKLSNDLIDSITQILEQKASGQIKLAGKPIFDGSGKKILQKSYDSEVVLVIGDWSRIEGDSELEKEIKEKTFELYRRDSRNVKILTFDELYERAKFIVERKS